MPSTKHFKHAKSPDDYEIRRLPEQNVLKADGAKFFAWRVFQKLALRCNGWLGFVEGTSRRPDAVIHPDEAEHWDRIDCAVKLQLAFNIDFSFLGEVLGDGDTSEDLWETLNNRFGRKTGQERGVAESKLRSRKLGTGETISQHIIALRTLRAEFINRGGSLKPSEWHAIVVSSLSPHKAWYTSALFSNPEDPEELIHALQYWGKS